MFEKLNKSVKTVKDGIDLQALDFVKLDRFVGQTINVDGFFFTNGKYGKQVVVVGNGFKVNMPQRAVEQFEEIQSDKKMLDATLEGHLKIVDIRRLEKTTGYVLADC